MSDFTEAKVSDAPPLVRVVGLRKSYTRGGWWAGRRVQVDSLRGVSLEIPAGSSLVLIGASGSGKSTLARCLAHLESPDSGEIWVAGKRATDAGYGAGGARWKDVQLIFQDPALSLNPRMTAAELIAEPLLIAGWGSPSQRLERAMELMTLVGLSPDAAHRRPRQFSGGQKRRLAIARALVIEPRMLILDEALGGLDLSTQAQIADRLLSIQKKQALTYLWISHDLDLTARLSTHVAVMDQGTIVELSPTEEFFAHPRSSQARVLLDAAFGRLSRSA